MRMPRVVDDQRLVFQQDTTLSQLSRLCPVAYTGALHARDIRERQNQLRHDCQIGRIPLTFPGPGINLDLYAQPPDDLHITDEHVHISSTLILNGVCVRWHGQIDLHDLTGEGRLEFDAVRADIEHARLRDEMRIYGERLQQLHDQLASSSAGGAPATTGHDTKTPPTTT